MNEQIKKLRKALNLTQQEFADRIKVKRNTVATYEMGRSEPSDAAISLICREFNVNETWLRTGEGEMFIEVSKDTQISEFVNKVLAQESDSFKCRFIAMLSQLSESDWEVLEKMAVTLVDQKGTLAPETTSPEAEKVSPEPAYGTEEWAEMQAQRYKQELLAEAQAKTFSA